MSIVPIIPIDNEKKLMIIRTAFDIMALFVVFSLDAGAFDVVAKGTPAAFG